MNVTLKDVLSTIFRYRSRLFLFSIYLCLGLGLFMLCSKKMYESQAEILVRFGQEQPGSAASDAAGRQDYAARREQAIQNEIRILRSNDTLTAAARVMAGPQAPLDDISRLQVYLARNLTASALRDSDVMAAAFLYPDPAVARATLEVILGQYQIRHGAVHFDSNELTLAGGRLESARREYAAAAQALTDFETANKIFDENRIRSLNEELEAQKRLLNSLANEHAYAVQKRDMLVASLGDLPPNVLYSVREIRNDARERLTERMAELRVQRQSLSGRYTDNSRVISDIDREIAWLDKQLNSEPERLIGDQETRANEAWNSLQQSLSALTPEVEAQRARIDNLTGQIQEMEAGLARAVSAQSSHALLSREASGKKDIYDRYQRMYADAIGRESAQRQAVTTISVVETPSLNAVPVKPDRKRLVVLGLIVLVAGNVCLLLASVFLENTLASPEQAEKALKRPVVGVFNARPLPGRAGRIGWGEPAPEEAYKTYRNDFLRLYLKVAKAGRPGCLLFASSGRDGDQALLAEDFALFAREYQQRRPVIVRYVPEGSGLARPMAEDGQPLPVRRGNGLDEYQIHDQADPAREAAFWRNLQTRHDLLIFSYAPLRESPLLSALADHCPDWVLFGLKAEKTNKYEAANAMSALEKFGFEKIGLILSERRRHIPAFLRGYLEGGEA